MTNKQKKIPPSRRKYEQANPVVSCRVPREIYDRLRALKKPAGASMAEVLKAGLGQFEVKVRAEEKVRQDGFDEGWEKAIEAASSLYAVTYSCSICGKEMTVQTEEEKEAIREFMTSSGWCHGDCESR